MSSRLASLPLRLAAVICILSLILQPCCTDQAEQGADPQRQTEDVRAAVDATREASAFASQGDFDAALGAWKRAAQLDPNHPRSRIIRNLELPAAGDSARALRTGRRAQEAAAKHDFLAAIQALQVARKANPLHYGLRLMEVKILARIRRFDEAGQAAEVLRQLYPTRREGWSVGADVAHALGDRPGAAEFVRAMRREFGNARKQELLNREDYLLAAGTFEDASFDAIATLNQILKRCPDHHEARQLLATRHEARGDFDEAARNLRELLARGLQSYSLHCRLARCLERAGHLDESIAAFSSASEFAKGQGLARMHAARLRGQREDRESWILAERELDLMIEKAPGLIPALESSIRIKTRLGKTDEVSLLRQLLEVAREGDRARTDNLRGMRDRLKSTPEDIEARRALVDYYFEIKEAGEAMHLVRELLIASPRHPDGLAWSARFFHETGKLESAWWEALFLSETAPHDFRGPLRMALVAATRGMAEACLNSGERALRGGAPVDQLRDALQWALRSPAGAKDPDRQRRIESLLR